jgi:hypothetical protein
LSVRITIRGEEWYPVWGILDERVDEDGAVEVDEKTVARWKAAASAFMQAQKEMHDLVSPPCPECGHRQVRHQEHSEGWDNWGCLDWYTDEEGTRTKRCRCRYGCPPERLAELTAKEE